jgi:hypothetical protein
MVVFSNSERGPCGGGLSQPARIAIVRPNAIASGFMKPPEKYRRSLLRNVRFCSP